MSDNNSEDTKINFKDVATKRLTAKVEAKLTEAMLQVLSSEDMLIASGLGVDVESLILEVSNRKIKELIGG